MKLKTFIDVKEATAPLKMKDEVKNNRYKGNGLTLKKR